MLLIWIVVHIISFTNGTKAKLNDLPVEIMMNALPFMRDADKWSFRTLHRKCNNAFERNDHHQIMIDIQKMFSYLEKVGNGSTLHALSIEEIKIIYKKIRMKELFLFKFPKIINNCFSHKDSVIRQELITTLDLWMENTNSSSQREDHEFADVENVLIEYSRKAFLNPNQFDEASKNIFKFIYAFSYNYLVQQTILPSFDSIYCDDVSHSKLRYLLNLIDKFGFILVHHSLLDTQWSSADLLYYLDIFNKIILFEDNAAFVGQMEVEFVMKLLQNDDCDLMELYYGHTANRELLQTLAELIEMCINFLIDTNQYKLGLFVSRVRNANGILLVEQMRSAQFNPSFKKVDTFASIRFLELMKPSEKSSKG